MTMTAIIFVSLLVIGIWWKSISFRSSTSEEAWQRHKEEMRRKGKF